MSGKFGVSLFVGFCLLAAPALAQQKGLTVEERPADVLEKAAGVGERYAVLIGISQYGNPAINLNFAAADAEALSKLLLDPEVGAYKPDNVRLLVNEQATRKNVMSALGSWLAGRVKPEDSVLVFYSGHGALGTKNDAYWVTYDADVEDLYASALNNKDISKLIAELPAKRKLTLIDSCFSEATAKSFKALVPGDVFSSFHGEGVVTMTASTGQEKSVELNGHGAFTFHLLDALQGKADTNGNGVVEVDELWNYLSDRVQKTAAEAGNRQTPVLLADRLEHGVPLTINPARAAGATLNELKKMYSDGVITVEEIGDAERLLTQRDGDPDARKLFRDLAAGVLTPDYFRQMRQLQAARPAAPPAPVAGTTRNTVDATAAAAAAAAAEASRAEPAAYILAESQNTEQGWETFLKQFPMSQLAILAQNRLDGLRKALRERETSLYSKAITSDAAEDWERLLAEFPAGRFVEEAVKRKADAARRREEDQTLTAARTTDTLGSWRTYLEKYPNGSGAANAGKRIDQLTWIETADLVAVPAGSFMMGNAAAGNGDAKAEHRVEVDAFRIGRGEVTNGLYLKFVEETKRPRPVDPDFAKNYMATNPDLPVVNVTYADAVAFCKWLGNKTGATVSLPTEAEWEYAALGGHDGNKYPWGAADPKTRALP